MRAKNAPYFILLLLCVNWLSAQPTKQNDWELLALKNKVSTLIEKKINETDTTEGRMRSFINEYHFNSNGYITRSVQKLINKDKPFSTMSITYDSLNNKTSETLDGKHYTYKNEFDKHNRLVRKTDYDSSNHIVKFHTYTYDTKNRLILLANYNVDNRLIRKTVFSYDKKNATTSKLYLGTGDLWFVTKYADGLSNNKVSDKEIRKNQESTWTYEYDLKGNQITVTNNRVDGVTTATNTYNEYGDRISSSFESHSIGSNYKSESTYTYEYDQKNNWITKTTYSNGNKIETITRQITYY